MEECVKASKEAGKKKKKIIHLRYLFYAFLAFLLGLTLARSLYAGEALYIAITIVILISVLIGLCLTKRFAMLIIIFSLFFVGNGLYFWGYSSFIGQTYEGNVAVVGRVSDRIDDHGDYLSLKLDNVTINGKSERNIWLGVELNGKSIKNGDILAFETNIEHVKLYEFGKFNFTYYRMNTPYRASVDLDEVVISEGGLRYDESIRADAYKLLQASMGEENANICFAVLFGDKSFVDGDTKDLYNNVGIIHILTVSGLHVGFLVALLYFLLKKVNKYIRFSVLFAVLLLYNILCGFTPSVLRASIMALVLLISKLSGREYDSLSSLSLAGFLIILPQPLVALDTGFLMSFFSVAGIFLLNKRIFKLLSKVIPEKIATYIAISISAQIGITPFVASFFSTYNFLAVFANLFILPVFGFLFPLLFVSFVIGLVLPFMKFLFHIIDWGFEVINYIAYIFGSSSLKVDLKPLPIVFNILLSLAMFVVSYFLMVESVVRWALLASIVFASCITFVVTDGGNREKNFMEYTDYPGSEVVYAVNEHGESLLVCQSADAGFYANYAHLRGFKSLDYIITFDNELNADNFETFGVKAVAYPDRILYNKEGYEIEKESKHQFGGFEFKYKFIDGLVAGVEFSVNNFVNFFANDLYLSYNIVESYIDYLESSSFAFNFLNKSYLVYPAQVKGEKLCTYSNDYINNSLYVFGNMKINFAKQNYTLRCVD